MTTLYGLGLYGDGIYGGEGFPSHYIHGTVVFKESTTEKQYLHGTALLAQTVKKYLHGTAFLEAVKQSYFTGSVELIYKRKKYLHGTAFLEAHKALYLSGRVAFVYGLLPYEVDEFQVIVDRQNVKFYWADSINLSNKLYSIYDSTDDGKTWTLLTTSTDTSYTLDRVPYDIADHIYRITVSSGALVSYGYKSFPSFSFRDLLDALDNGYWDLDPTANIYKLYEGIMKEAHCRAELEKDYTNLDSNIKTIRNQRISEVYGSAFDQEVTTADEDYRRKIWNLFLGFRNSVTFEGLYNITKAFTGIPPKISKLSEDGWILGKRYLGTDTIPLSEIAAQYGTSFKIHLQKQISCAVTAVVDSSTVWDTSAEYGEFLNTVSGYYNDKFLVFKTGNNSFKSRKIMNYTYSGGIGRFTTKPFVYDSTAGDTLFVSSASIEEIEKYIRLSTNLHSYLLFKYYPDYITENSQSGFSGTLSNLEVVPSRRLRVTNVDETIVDEGKVVQAVYDSGVTLSKFYPLSDFGGQGVVCWDMIEWGGADIDFKMYITFADDTTSNNWVYQSGKTRYLNFTGIQEENLDPYIVEDSEVVYDTSGISYIKNVDYIMDYREGTIRRSITSNIPTTRFMVVEYDTKWGEVRQNQTLSFTKPYFKYKFVINDLRDTEDFEFSGFYIKKFK